MVFDPRHPDRVPQVCACGCGGITKGGRHMPGHNGKRLTPEERAESRQRILRSWRERNKERIREYANERYRTDEKTREYRKSYNQRPGKRAATFAYTANRMAAQYGVPERLTAADVLPIAGPCAYCDGEGTGRDHVIPLSRGGPNTVANLVPCCKPCNVRKNARTPEEWYAAR